MGCTSVGDSFEVQFLPAADGAPDSYTYSYGLGCGDGYRPTHDEVFAPRPDATGTTSSPVIDDGCQSVASGQLCLGMSDEIRGEYAWTGSLTHGRARLGQSDLPAPACDSGSAVVTSTVRTLLRNDAIRLGFAAAQSGNWSLTFDQAYSTGGLTGVSTVTCRPSP
ncbi:hypothetical protein RH864_15455 [Agromyces sp. LY-1074]|nr:hypothetical protein [Agromyces sp. LY-1074]